MVLARVKLTFLRILITHAVLAVGMTGSGKTGLLTVMVEEALRDDVPVPVMDIKGDLPTCPCAFRCFSRGGRWR